VLQTLRPPIHLPRANTDSVSSPHAALAVFSLAIRRPLCEEMLVLMHDNQLRGVGLMSFDAVASFSSNINHAIGLCSSVLDATSFSICTVEPLTQDRTTDATNWQNANRLCKSAGLTLNYWLVVARGSVINVREHN
jgi:coproporphyrinogen III oxidase